MNLLFWIYLASCLVYLAAFVDSIRLTRQVTSKDVFWLVFVGAMPVINTVMACLLAVYAAKRLLSCDFWDKPLWTGKR